KSARRAVKADPNSTEGARAVGAVYAERMEWDKAITALEKARGGESDIPTMLELASYRMRRALLPENAATFMTELAGINDLRRKAADLAVEQTIKQNTASDGTVTAQGHEAIGDALMEPGR